VSARAPWNPTHSEIASCAIVTTSANGDVRFVHDRMPAVLDGRAAEAAWLDPTVDLDAAVELLVRPLRDGLLDVYARPFMEEVARDDAHSVFGVTRRAPREAWQMAGRRRE
jgi:putative SOS response-associated peptidase YedK